MDEKLFGYTIKQWARAALDMLDGNSYWTEIQYNTGMSEERCKELMEMFNKASDEDWPALLTEEAKRV